MTGKEQIMYRVKRYGVAFVLGLEMGLYFDGNTEAQKQQIDKFCWENVLTCKPAGGIDKDAYLFWPATDETPEMVKE